MSYQQSTLLIAWQLIKTLKECGTLIICKEKAYEKAYGKKLTYDFDYDDIAGYVKE